MKSDNSERRQKLIELCCLVVERRKAEQAYDRAQWRVSYHRKAKVRLENSLIGEKQALSVKRTKKKIEIARLWALQKQKELAEVRKRLIEPITKAKNSIFASFRYGDDGRVNSIWLPDIENRSNGIELEMDKIVEMVDQYEADTTLTKALEDNRGYETDV